jgi:phosphoribosylformylglycinamidine synthase I
VKWGVVVFPGSNDDRDTLYAIEGVLGERAVPLWHKSAELGDCDALVLPGGFSYGDYLRCGALARFSPIMRAVNEFAAAGGPVLGICNGFQILCEAGLLPGALVRNRDLRFLCRDVRITVENSATAFSAAYDVGQTIRVPIKHGEGCYAADPSTLGEIAAQGRVVFRYTDGAPNGSLDDIAGISNAAGNVVGLMPHPEHAVDALLGVCDGRGIFESPARWLDGAGERRASA